MRARNRCLRATIIALCSSVVAPATIAAAENSGTAVHLAVTIIHEQARDLQTAGQTQIATQLERLAVNLERGEVSLNDAELVVQIALAGQQLRAVALNTPTLIPTPPPLSAAQAANILDGSQHEAPATVASPPVASAPTTSAPVSTAVTVPIQTAPATGPATTPVESPPVTTVPAVKGPVAKVLDVATAADGKISLVLINAGNDQNMRKGQLLMVHRGQAVIAEIQISDLKATMAACSVVIDPSAATDAVKSPGPILRDDDVFNLDPK